MQLKESCENSSNRLKPVARRRCRRPFHPSRHVGGPYRLPVAVMDELGVRLQGRRNAESSYRLAAYLARNHAGFRLAEAFTVARRRPCAKGERPVGGLTDATDLGLTENQVRGAIATLVDIGFLVPAVAGGNGWQGTAYGPRIAAKRFHFGGDFFPLFQRAKAARRVVATKSPRSRTYGPRVLDLGEQVKAEALQGPLAPVAPEGLSVKRPGLGWVSGPEKVAALATLEELQGKPLPMLSVEALNAGRFAHARARRV